MALPILRRGGSPVPVRRTDSSRPINGFGQIDPWNDLAVMDRVFDNLFHSPFPLRDRSGAAATYQAEPQVELYETGDDLLAYVYAPGLAADSFDISAGPDAVSIRGERKPLLEVGEGMTSHTPWGGLATSGGTFDATYSLPVEIDPNKVQAAYKDGVLHLRMAKSEASKPRHVKVQVGQ